MSIFITVTHTWNSIYGKVNVGNIAGYVANSDWKIQHKNSNFSSGKYVRNVSLLLPILQ